MEGVLLGRKVEGSRLIGGCKFGGEGFSVVAGVVAAVVVAEREGGEAHMRVDWMLPGVQALIHAGLVGGDESRTMRGVYLGEGGDWIYTWG